MAFGVENGGDSGTPAGRPLPYLKHALPARQENVQSLYAFLELCVQYFAHRQAIDKITNCGSVKVDALQKSKKRRRRRAFLKTKGTVCRRILATFILAAMLVTSSAVTAYAAPEGATVIDLTVAGGGGGQDSSACVLHSSYDDDGHFLICDTHTGTGTWNGRAHENGRVDYKKHDIKYFGAEPNCNVLKPVGYWYCADG